MYLYYIYIPHQLSVFLMIAQEFLNDLVLIDVQDMTGTTVNAVDTQLPVPIANCTLSAVGNKVV